MNICVDVGNTYAKIGLFGNDNKFLKLITFSTVKKITVNEMEVIIKSQLGNSLEGINEEKHIIVSSVVPSINVALKTVLKRIFGENILFLAPGVKTGVPMKLDNPSEVGCDLIADIVGARSKYGFPVIVADLGTASKVLLIDKDGFFSSVSIMPGIFISASSLSQNGEMLPIVSLEAPKKVLARNTIDSMNSGIVYGHSEMISGLVDLYEKELGYSCKKIITGGGSIHVKDIIRGGFIYDKELALDGLNIILNKNKGEKNGKK